MKKIIDLGKIGITLAGEYNDKTIYEKLTIVLYKGKSYISTKTVQGLSPEQDIRSWQLVAEAKDAYHMLVDAGKTTLTEEEFLEQLVDATKGRYIVQGNIINAADEEDLTVEHSDLLGVDTLKLANRDNTKGMGYIILRKNKSFAEQVTKENTIYEIRYDFILENDITIPTNCILKFNGGSISGSNTINLNYCSCIGNISFKGIKINNFNGSITAKQLGLSQGDNIANIIGTGWKDCDVDLENIALIQRVGDIKFSGNYCHIIRWNINRINSKETKPTDSNLAEARLIFTGIPNLIIEYCTFDGTGSNVNFVGGNFYFTFNGISILNCPNAIVRYNTIKNFPATCGIFAEVSDNISIIDNVVKNCSIYVTPVGDTNGDGIYVRTTKNSIIKNNIVDIDDSIQIGRCGICHENYASGIIENNTISGYDRGIHIEHCYDYNTVRNNHITRCHSAIMLWADSDYKNTGNIAYITIENNYISNKGMVKSSINSKNYTPLTYGRAIISLLNAAGDSHEENKRTEFINNTIESFDTGDFNGYCMIETDYSGKWVNNKFVRNGSHIPEFYVNHYHLTYLNHLYFCDNDFEGKFYSQNNSYVKMHNNIIKQLVVTFFSILNFDLNNDYTTQISIQNNTYQMLAESRYPGGAVAIFGNFGGIFRNNVWGLGTAHYSLFDEQTIAKGSVIDNNVFQRTHSYEGKNIWHGRSTSDVSPNLTPGKNLLVDLINGSNTVIIDNPQYSA